MLINNQIPAGEYRHNYLRLAFVVGTLILFIGHVAVNQLSHHGNNRRYPFSIGFSNNEMISYRGVFANATLRTEDVVINDVTPSEWVYRGLDALNSLWQVKWTLPAYCMSFVSLSLVVGLASLLVDLSLPSFNHWLSLHFTEDFHNDVLQRVYYEFPRSDNLALGLLSNLHPRKSSTSIIDRRRNIRIGFFHY